VEAALASQGEPLKSNRANQPVGRAGSALRPRTRSTGGQERWFCRSHRTPIVGGREHHLAPPSGRVSTRS